LLRTLTLRRALAAVVLAITCGGIVAGAAAGPRLSVTYSATAVVSLAAVAPGRPDVVAAAATKLAGELRSTRATATVGTMSGGVFGSGSVQVVAQPGSSAIQIVARRGAAVVAEGTVDWYANAALALYEEDLIARVGTIAIGNFESGLDGWEQTPPIFPVGSARYRLSRLGPRFGARFLAVRCGGQCAVYRRVFNRYEAGRSYRFSVWLREGRRPILLRASVGTGADLSQTQPFALTHDWHRYAFDWTPSRSETSAELVLQTAKPGSISVDGAAFADPAAGAAETDASLFAGPARRPTIERARPTELLRRSLTESGAIGGFAGLAVGLAAAGSALAAARRRDRDSQPAEHPGT
jgi:hypothetical protein